MRQALHAGVFLPLVLLAVASRADDITLVPGAKTTVTGGRVTGQIQSESPTSVRIKPATGPAIDIPVEQIQSISYSGQPATLTLAESRLSGGALDDAVAQYKAAAAAASKDLIKQAALFGQARVMAVLAEAEPSRAGETLAFLDGFLNDYPQSRHRAPALEWLAKLALAQSSLDKASQALDQLATIPWAASRALGLRTRVLSRQGKHDEAIAAAAQLVTQSPAGSEAATEARLIRAEALVAANRAKEAESDLQDLIKQLPPESLEMQAHAYNALGDCLRASGKTKDALYAYLHTDVLFDQDKEQHAKALANVADLWKLLKRDDRAEEVLERLRQLYPQSPYTPKAKAAP